ncbi:hypothetical protein BCV70DRAFT_164762 [Testicularia cyperi]|uniref:Golgi apparatus membrane protein TVP38 n=1 Tax=Testicularia cyperi TaxID=1882483 RepID=A0A317XJG0_9BASI|nr:hypothetical protein BCV70DRAFT_164762 [Testicularia cyperi]
MSGGTERRNHPGHLSAFPLRGAHASRSPSPLSGSKITSSSMHASQAPSQSTLAQRFHHFSHASAGSSNITGARRFSQHADDGSTPNFELPSDGMFSAADAAASGSGSYWLPPESRSQSVPPRIFVQSQKRMPPQIDTTGKHYTRKDSLMEESEKRPTSPHITSATPTSARIHNPLHGPGQHHHQHRSGSGHEQDSQRARQNRSPGAHRVGSPGILQSAVSAAQSLMDAVAGRSSPVANRSRPAIDDRDSLSDDEAGKGHGRKAAGRFTPSSHTHHYNQQHHPKPHPQAHAHFYTGAAHDKAGHLVSEPEEMAQGISGNVEWRTSFTESRRATPAAYRPNRPHTPRKRGSGQQDGDDSTDMRLPNSHHSTHSSIHIGSPIVVPQARRGAVHLRPRRRRRVARQFKPQLTVKQKLVVAVAGLVQLLRLLASPVEALHRFREWRIDTRIWLDEAFRDPTTGARSYRPPWLQAYVPLLIWLGISLTSTATVITFHTEVFVGLDHLSTYLQGLGLQGKVLLGSLIFLTTFPPLPLYSTLIMLCGFTFGLWDGFVISYIAAISGAIVVFVLSRSLLKDWMAGLLNKSGGLKKVVRAIEKQPKLLFLVRLAPYPYNLMNTLLASSPTLTLRTYVLCTALALPKLMIHVALGKSIKSFAEPNGSTKEMTKEEEEEAHTAETVKKWAGLVGVGLCIGIMVYLLSVARKAVDELDDDEDDDELLDGEDQDLLLSSDFDDDDDDDVHRDDSAGVDMRERAGPGSVGFRNGYAPITASPEERLRQSMRQPVPMSLGNSAYDRGSGSFEDRISQSNHSGSLGGQSIDLAERIAEMEAHAEGMQFGPPLTTSIGAEPTAVLGPGAGPPQSVLNILDQMPSSSSSSSSASVLQSWELASPDELESHLAGNDDHLDHHQQHQHQHQHPYPYQHHLQKDEQ